MKINITNEQYKELITGLAIADGILGVLGDILPEADYKKRSDKMSELEEYFLQYAKDFNCEEFTQDDDGKKILDDDIYENKILPIITDYEEYATEEQLSNELAWRDFRRDHSDKEMEEMRKKNGGYFGVALYDYEKKYWDEFEKNGFERLEIKG